MGLEPEKLRALSGEELANEERALREEIWKLRLQQVTGQIQNGHIVREKRHDLARVLTIMTELGSEAQAGGPKR